MGDPSNVLHDPAKRAGPSRLEQFGTVAVQRTDAASADGVENRRSNTRTTRAGFATSSGSEHGGSILHQYSQPNSSARFGLTHPQLVPIIGIYHAEDFIENGDCSRIQERPEPGSAAAEGISIRR